MRKNTEDCDRYNAEQARQAKQIVANEAAAGNPHALPATLEVTAYNADQVRPICTGVGAPSDYACNDGTTVVVNADIGAPAIAAFLVHEEQHPLGARKFGKNSPAAKEPCANKRQTLFVYNMHDPNQKNAALANPQIHATQNPNQPGCGF